MLSLTEDQVLHFRARRSHLAGDGATDATAAARSVLGVQAQQLEPALMALSQRTAGRPTAAALEACLFGDDTRGPLVRTWGQRDTIHIYDAAHHWRSVIGARGLWSTTGRRGPMPSEELLKAAASAVEAFGRPLTRKDLYGVAGQDYLDGVVEISGKARQTVEHFAAGRLLWKLAESGAVSAARKVGSEQQYAARSLWYPALPWAPDVDAGEAAVNLTREYLGVYGPATVKDVSHFFGTKVSVARGWVETLSTASELVDVSCGGRKGLVALARDVGPLSAPAPNDWPARLVPKFDTMLMAHFDKTWTVPNAEDTKQIWRKSAQVMATVMVRGRIVATWTHKVRAKDAVVRVSPLRGYDSARRAELEAEAEGVARHLGRTAAQLKVAS